VVYVAGPGHGEPGLVANAYLDGTYSEVSTGIGRDTEGLRKLFRQFSFPGGTPSHVAPATPGSTHEGGELGYSVAHNQRLHPPPGHPARPGPRPRRAARHRR